MKGTFYRELTTVLGFHILHSGISYLYNNIYDGRLLLQLLIQTSLLTRSGNTLWRQLFLQYSGGRQSTRDHHHFWVNYCFSMLSTTKSTLQQLRLVLTSTLSLKPDLQTNNAQVLKTVNPNVRFHIPDTTQLIPGVAIHLKGLVGDCDAIGIPHPSERHIIRSSK